MGRFGKMAAAAGAALTMAVVAGGDPEVSSWALLLLGLGVIGVALSSRRVA